MVTIGPDTGLREALGLMKAKGIRHLPVVANGKCVGLVSSAELKQAVLASMLEDLNVSELMIATPFTISRDTSMDKAARIIYEKDVGCLPVLENGRVIGIITVKDILKAFIEFLGVLQSDILIDVILKDVPGSFDEITSIIQQTGGQVISVGISMEKMGRVHHFRISGGDPSAIANELVRLGYKGVGVIE